MSRPRNHSARDRILDAAETLLAEQGEVLSLVEVARRAGVSRGTIYRRFPSRPALIEALVAERDVDPDAARATSTRTRILDAVAALLRDRDFAALKAEDVADRADVGIATVYRHFGDRDGLLSAFAAERSPRRFAAGLTLTPGDRLEDDLRGLARAALRFVTDYPHLLRAAFASAEERARLPAALREHPKSARAALQGYFARQVQAGRVYGDPALLGRMFMGLVVAVATPALSAAGESSESTNVGDAREASEASGASRSPNALADVIVQTMLHGCAVRPPETRDADRDADPRAQRQAPRRAHTKPQGDKEEL